MTFAATLSSGPSVRDTPSPWASIPLTLLTMVLLYEMQKGKWQSNVGHVDRWVRYNQYNRQTGDLKVAL